MEWSWKLILFGWRNNIQDWRPATGVLSWRSVEPGEREATAAQELKIAAAQELGLLQLGISGLLQPRNRRQLQLRRNRCRWGHWLGTRKFRLEVGRVSRRRKRNMCRPGHWPKIKGLQMTSWASVASMGPCENGWAESTEGYLAGG